jgi:hypothetical protein
MNVENYDPQGEQSQARKSGGGKLLKIGGCGCLVLLLLCGGGIGYFVYKLKPSIQMMQESISMVQESEAVKAKLGNPITITQQAFPKQSVEDGTQRMEYEMPISGPNGSGTMHLKVEVNGIQLERRELYVDVDGEKIDLINSAEFKLDIDDGAGGD